jgi:hypothetical protein
MRTVIGTILGMIIGVFIGAAAMNYWSAPSVSVLKKSNKDGVPSTEAYFLCQSSLGGKESPLIIKSVGGNAKSMVFSWRSVLDIFNIEETTDLHYTAYERNPEAPEAYSSIDLNRVTGEFILANKLSDGARDLLTSICERRVPGNECEARLKTIKGGGSSDCWTMIDESACARIKNTGIPSRFKYQCRASERRF